MRHSMVRLATSVALGAITSVGLAWGLAARSRMQGSMTFTVISAGPNGGMVARESTFGIRRRTIRVGGVSVVVTGVWDVDRSLDLFINAEARKTLGKSLQEGTFPAWWGSKPDERARSEYELWAGSTQAAYGWPLPALWCEWREVLTGSGGFIRVEGPEGGFDLTLSASPMRMGADPYRALPWRPVWLGLAGDTACFGSVWFAVLMLPGARRTFRLRRGLCAACGYDLTGKTTGVCPECGAKP
jgi:hypothetical protein